MISSYYQSFDWMCKQKNCVRVTKIFRKGYVYYHFHFKINGNLNDQTYAEF